MYIFEVSITVTKHFVFPFRLKFHREKDIKKLGFFQIQSLNKT